jgi:hypothetical protein
MKGFWFAPSLMNPWLCRIISGTSLFSFAWKSQALPWQLELQFSVCKPISTTSLGMLNMLDVQLKNNQSVKPVISESGFALVLHFAL